MNYTQAQIDAYVSGLYNGDLSPTDLPVDLYYAIADKLLGGVKEGVGSLSVEFGAKDEELISVLSENIYMFSAAKTFQQTLEMSDAMTKDGELIPFKDFRLSAQEIFVKYNGGELDNEIKPGWLEAEYNTAIIQASNAKKWKSIEKQKETFPYLLRVAVEDEAECEICGELNGICLPVDDPFWVENGGASHFNCRCLIEQVEKAEGEDLESDEDEVDEAVEKANVPDGYKYNPGITDEIFSTEGKSKHPYFSVPKEYIKFAENNFNLKIPK